MTEREIILDVTVLFSISSVHLYLHFDVSRAMVKKNRTQIKYFVYGK